VLNLATKWELVSYNWEGDRLGVSCYGAEKNIQDRKGRKYVTRWAGGGGGGNYMTLIILFHQGCKHFLKK